MRVVLVTALYPPEFQGGVEGTVRSQAQDLARAGHAVRVISGTLATDMTPAASESQAAGVEVVRLPRLPHEVYDLEFERPRIDALLQEHADGAEIVHLQHWWTLSSHAVRSLAQVAPVVVSLHDLFVSCPRFFRRPLRDEIDCPGTIDFETCAACVAPDAPGRSAAALVEGLTRRMRAFSAELEAASALVFPSQAHLERLATFMPLPARTHVMAPVSALHFPGTAARPELWTGATPLRVLCCGRRSPEKGTLDLVRALQALPVGTVELVLPGGSCDAEFDAELERVAGGLPLELTGVYNAASLERIAATCHLAAFPTQLDESYALVVDEALSLGLPVWTSAGACVRERLACDAVRHLPGREPVVWSAAFAELIHEPAGLAAAYRALPQQGTRRESSATRLLTLYSNLLAAGADR